MTMKSKLIGVRIDPGKSVGVDDMNARREEGFVVELGEHGMRGEEFGHLGVEIDQGDAFDLRIFQNLADGEAVAAAEDQNAPRRRERQRGRDGSALRDSDIRRAS